MSCKWVAKDRPRVVIGRHEEDCADESCRGCQECVEGHCRICSRVHADGTCAECLAIVRADLHEIARLCDSLPEEVEHRGVEGEAMMLLGPVADPEAWGHTAASVAVGRLSADYLETADNELHPLFVLGGWDISWRDALEHSDAGPLALSTAVDYLDRQMTYMAGYEHMPFEDFAKDLRRCVGRLEAVLHDGEQHDRGAPCMTCNVPLERVWGDDEAADGWKCPRCRETSTEDQYRFAVAHLHREEATHLTDRDMELRTGVKAGTVRVWAQRGDVERRRDQGRTIYCVADVLRVVGSRGLAS
jgi:hypothetical protein